MTAMFIFVVIFSGLNFIQLKNYKYDDITFEFWM